MRTSKRPLARLAAAATAVGVVVLVAAAAAQAYPYTLGPQVLVSGPSPFASCTFGGNPADNFVNAEVEPFVAVNPRNAANIVGVFQQDRWRTVGGAHGLVAGWTKNGGATWGESWAALSACAGADPADPGNARSSDPWVTFDPAGNAYQISITFSSDETISSVLVSKSTNGGVSWAAPKTLIRTQSDLTLNDKESITADPTRPGYVYAIWDQVATLPGQENRGDQSFLHSFAYRAEPTFSRSTDGGATWSPAVHLSSQNMFTIGHQIVVLPDGTLVDVFDTGHGSGLQPSPNQIFEGVMLSTDAGVTWTPPSRAANEASLPVIDPETGKEVRAGTNIPDVAVDTRSGTLYVVWADGRFSGGIHDDIALVKSTDGGKTWSAPVMVNAPAGVAAFTPAVAVSSDGTVGVTYYDIRNNTAAPGLTTDVWLAHSHDGGATWSEQHLAGPFDMETAPFARGYFVGDYEGLTAIGRDFMPFFVIANSGNTANRTDVFSIRAKAP